MEMKREKQALYKINILIQQIAESIHNGEIEMRWVIKQTDEIEKLINEIE